jgi:hypothetical protein
VRRGLGREGQRKSSSTLTKPNCSFKKWSISWTATRLARLKYNQSRLAIEGSCQMVTEVGFIGKLWDCAFGQKRRPYSCLRRSSTKSQWSRLSSRLTTPYFYRGL